jgi:hypothetical protein
VCVTDDSSEAIQSKVMNDFKVALSYQLDLSRFPQPFGSDMGNLDVHDYAQKHSLSSNESKFLSLLNASELQSRVFSEGELIFETGKSVAFALLIMDGEALWEVEPQPVRLGQGAVLGMAEGIAGLRSLYNLRASSQVRCKVIEMSKLLPNLETANAGLKGLFRVSLERILKERFNDPSSLKHPKSSKAS